jgi:ABC-2 type transport system permease protein
MSTAIATIDTNRPVVPLSRLVKVELRKMFDTRSGFWLMASIVIIASLATIAVILFVNDDNLTFGAFGAAVGFPMQVILPMIAILSVTGEWSQRTGLISFTLVPHRSQIILAKALAAILVGVLSMLLAFAIGAVGNIVGSALNGVDPTWDMGFAIFLQIILANVLGMLIGFMLGVLIRNSAGAIVAYFVYSLLLPIVFGIAAGLVDWFKDLQPWVDFNFAQSRLFDDMTGDYWANVAVSSIPWLIIPLAVGLWAVLRSEVK